MQKEYRTPLKQVKNLQYFWKWWTKSNAYEMEPCNESNQMKEMEWTDVQMSLVNRRPMWRRWWMNRSMSGRMDRWMDGWMDEMGASCGCNTCWRFQYFIKIKYYQNLDWIISKWIFNPLLIDWVNRMEIELSIFNNMNYIGLTQFNKSHLFNFKN